MIKIFLKNIKIVFKITPLLSIIKIALCIISAFMVSVNLLITQRVIESVQEYFYNNIEINAILKNVIFLILIMTLIIFNSYIDNILNLKIQKKINIAIGDKIINKYKKIEFKHYDVSDTLNIIKNTSKNPDEKIFNLFINSIEIVSKIFTIIGLSILFFQVSVILTVIYIFFILIITFLDYKSMNEMNKMFNNQTSNERKLEYYSSILCDKNVLCELNVFNSLKFIKEKWNFLSSIVLNERINTTIKTRKYFLLSSLLLFLWICIIYFILIYNLITLGSVFLALFITLMSSANTIMENTESLSFRLSMLSQNSYVIENYEKFMNLSEIEDDTNYEVSDSFFNHIKIEFKNVYFKYPNSNEFVLKNLSFIIYGNEKIALVGINGAGKSTIIKLLCKLYYPNKGEILINDLNIKNISNDTIRKIFSGVFQNYVEYSLTLRENIAMTNILDILNDDKILKCLEKCNFEEKIDLGQNLGKIEDNGIDLSKGQWQKIALARAYFSNSKILILDEPTSSLDPIAENKIYRTFQEVLGDKGSIIISHRLGSAKIADKILVLDKGKIVEQGTHYELMLKNDVYANMFNAQRSWYIVESDENEE